MRGDQLSRQWRIIRAIEASPNGLTVAEIAKREETGMRTIYRDLEVLRAAGFPPKKSILSSKGAKIANKNIWKFLTPYIGFLSLFSGQNIVKKKLCVLGALA